MPVKMLSADWRPKVVRMLEERIIGHGLQGIAAGLARRREGRGWIAELRGAVAGWADGYLRDDGVAYVRNVFVRPDHQRLGIGSRLIDEVESWAWALGAPKLSLDTTRVLIGAHAFYIGRGYGLVGSHRLDGELRDVTMLDFEKAL